MEEKEDIKQVMVIILTQEEFQETTVMIMVAAT